jgi:hypothetical protein
MRYNATRYLLSELFQIEVPSALYISVFLCFVQPEGPLQALRQGLLPAFQRQAALKAGCCHEIGAAGLPLFVALITSQTSYKTILGNLTCTTLAYDLLTLLLREATYQSGSPIGCHLEAHRRSPNENCGAAAVRHSAPQLPISHTTSDDNSPITMAPLVPRMDVFEFADFDW